MRQRDLRILVMLFLAVLLILGGRIAWAQDPTTPGPYDFERVEYNFGDRAYNPAGLGLHRVELLASVHYPVLTESNVVPEGRLPLLIFLHGRHPTLVNAAGNPILKWPPTAADTRIDSYKGYDYAAERLATQGYIVVSISANGINAFDNGTADGGMTARSDLIAKHLSILQRFDTTGMATENGVTQNLDQLIGHFDFGRIGLMGHSRGGEGVVTYVAQHPNGGGNPFTVLAVLPLAPTDFNGRTINRVPIGVLLPYCDGDLDDLQGVHYYDRARYNVPGDPAEKNTFLVMGANHNFYNTQWSPMAAAVKPAAIDDWCLSYKLSPYRLVALVRHEDPACGGTIDTGPTGAITGVTLNAMRLSEGDQRATGLGILTAFFRTNVGSETEFLPLLKGDVEFPATTLGEDIYVTYHPPDDPADRLVVNNYLPNPADAMVPLEKNTLLGPVDQKLLDPYNLCGRTAAMRCLPAINPLAREPHTPEDAVQQPGLTVLRFAWDSSNAVYYTELPPANEDVSGYEDLQFRVSVNFSSDLNNAVMMSGQDLIITLADANGESDDFQASDVETLLDRQNPLYYPPGQAAPYSDGTRGPVPHCVLNMIRVPLLEFPDVDLTQLVRIYFRFTDPTQGALFLSDIMFAN